MDNWTKFHSIEGTFVLLLTLAVISFAEREYCADESYIASCDPGEVIVMEEAKVGRMFKGRCVDIDRGHLGCSGDALTHMDAQCSGKQQCQVPVVEVGKKISNCPNDLMKFLLAQHQCVPAVSCNKAECERSDFLRPTAKSGFLASSVSNEIGCGTMKCPWMINVLEGQTINFTLYDFTLAADTKLPCIRFGVIFDGHERRELDNCKQKKERKSHIYTSITNSVNVELYRKVENYNFIIHYSVYGCPDMATPKNAETERKGDVFTVKCQHSNNIWHLTCNGNQWIGETGTCPDSQVNPEGSKDLDSTSSSLGMLFVIGLGVALGIAVGFILLCIVAAYMKRKHKSQAQKADPLLHGNPQYRDYLSKTGTMFGLYPTGQMIQEAGDHTLIYRPVHDYTSTLHPHQHRPIPQTHEVLLTHQFRPDFHPDDGWDSSVYNQSTGTSAHGAVGCPASVGKPGSETGSESQQPREHIYELPQFPDRHRAHSADSGLAYSVTPYTEQTNHRTT